MQRAIKKLHLSPPQRWQVLGAGHYRAAKNVDMPMHHHSQSELVYYPSGAVDCLVQGTTRAGHAGLYWLTPPGIAHGERAVGAYECYWILLEDAVRVAQPVFLDDDAHRSMGHVCQQIVTEWGGQAAGRARMLRLLAEQASCLFDRAAGERVLSPAEQTVLRAERWMEERCGLGVEIGHVARECGVSTSALRNYFGAVRGCSPRDHLRRVRFDRAVRFLRTSNLKLEAIAELCGYDSASHLSRCVKEFTGQSPGRIRARAVS